MVNFSSRTLFAAIFLLLSSICSAETVELKGKITLTNAGGMPATAIMHSTGDESYVGTANIDKEGNFSFKVEVPKATLFNVRIMRMSADVLLTAAEKTTTLLVTFDDERVKSTQVDKSPENDAYKTYRSVVTMYAPKLRGNFANCEKPDSCERELHSLLMEYAHELSVVRQNYKGTYTADVLCKMRMPSIAKSSKGTYDQFRKDFFSNVDFSDSTIFGTSEFRDMVGEYIDYIVEPRLSKENDFIKYFTERIKSNPAVLHKSAGLLFDELMKKQKEKMLAMFITWYNTGDNKTSINSAVLDVRLRNISKVMPGQPYIDISAPDSSGEARTLKEVVDKSKCTLLIFWSSECSHCRDEMPFVKAYYKKYHDKGLGIYAVSLEMDPEKWKTYVKDQGLEWTNVLSGHAGNPNPAMQYVSVSTPTLILIDSKGNILHRFVPKNKLEDHIIEALK